MNVRNPFAAPESRDPVSLTYHTGAQSLSASLQPILILLATVLFCVAMWGPLGAMLLCYIFFGGAAIAMGADPIGLGTLFALLAPWPTMNVFGAWLVLVLRPRRIAPPLKLAAAASAGFSAAVATLWSRAICASPDAMFMTNYHAALYLWSAAVMLATIAILLPSPLELTR